MREYIAEQRLASKKGLGRGRSAELLRRISSHSMREWGKLHGTTLLVPVSKLKARRLLESTNDIHLHLGSGTHRLPGWINIDILGMHPDLYWDLRRGIPFPEGSARAVFLEHVLEHFSLAAVLDVLEECYRVLAPKGRIRVGVPDLGRYIQSYAGDGTFIEEMRPGRPTPLLALAEVALSHGHRSVWDATTLERVLTECGFAEVRARRFGDSDIEPAPDSPSPRREAETVYAEGEKPLP